MKAQLLLMFFLGVQFGDSIKGDWADVPLGNARNDGHLTLLCSQNAHNYILTKTLLGLEDLQAQHGKKDR